MQTLTFIKGLCHACMNKKRLKLSLCSKSMTIKNVTMRNLCILNRIMFATLICNVLQKTNIQQRPPPIMKLNYGAFFLDVNTEIITFMTKN